MANSVWNNILPNSVVFNVCFSGRNQNILGRRTHWTIIIKQKSGFFSTSVDFFSSTDTSFSNLSFLFCSSVVSLSKMASCLLSLLFWWEIGYIITFVWITPFIILNTHYKIRFLLKKKGTEQLFGIDF